MKTTNNTIFISGGSAGIGLAIARELSEKGNHIIINGRNPERLKEALKQIRNATAIQGDLSIESERIRIAEELKANHGDVNVVINNAGAAFAYSLSSDTNAYENASREMETNYLGIIHFTELMLPLLMKKDSAAIINVTSIVGLVPAAGVPTYSASKAALRAYTQSLRTSLGNTSVKVFELLPPLVNTEFSAPIGGANGIPPRDVATELMAAMEGDRFEVPVGQTKIVHSVIHGALSTLNA